MRSKIEPAMPDLSRETLRDDPHVAQAFRRLACRVFEQAVEDFRSGTLRQRDDARRFLGGHDAEAERMRGLWHAHVDDLISLDRIVAISVESEGRRCN